jgi:uncharacterized membrane protein YfcA
MQEWGILVLTGFGVGLVVGLTSLGGATLLTPFLILVVGVRPHIAIGTDVLYAAATKIVGSFIQWRQGLVEMKVVRAMAIGSLPAGLLASLAVATMGRLSYISDKRLRELIGITLVVVTLLVVFRGGTSITKPTKWSSPRHRDMAASIWGAIVGSIVGLTSIGSGTLVLPFLLWAYDIPAARLVATDMFHAAILLSLTGALFAGFGSIQWNLVVLLTAGALPGVTIGSRLAHRLPDKVLRVVLVAVLLFSAWKLLQ